MDKYLKIKVMLNIITTSKIFLEVINNSIYNTYVNNKHIMNESCIGKARNPLMTFSSPPLTLHFS